MSNYNWETLPGFDLSIGAEVVNGTGEVRIITSQDDDTVVLDVPAEQALDLARLIAQQAHDSMRAKFVSDHITRG